MEDENVELNNEEIKERDKKVLEINKKSIKVVFNIVAVICITLYCIAISSKTFQNDTYYTVTIGEYIYNNGISNLTEDLYSWFDLPYCYPHWLYDFCMYLVYSNFGFKGLFASTIILSSILGISIYTLCCKKSDNRIVSLAITIGACYILRGFMTARAQLPTFILFAWTVLSIEKFLETRKARYAFALIVIPLLLANMHSAVFPFYFVLYAPYVVEYFLSVIDDLDLDIKIYSLVLKIRRKIVRKEKSLEKIEKLEARLKYNKNLRREKREKIKENPYKIKVTQNHVVLILMIIMIVAASTGAINPAGNNAYTYLYKTMKGNTPTAINEHLPLTLVENDEFLVALVIFIIVLLFTDSKIKLSDLFMLAGLTYLSFKSRRQVALFAILCSPILASLIAQFIDKYDRKNFLKLERFVASWFGAIVVVCLVVIWTTNKFKEVLKYDYVDTSSYPVEASDWIISNLDIYNIKLYNEYNYGSYLLFRGIPVFIDSRADLYTPEFNGTYDAENKCYNGRDIFSDAVNIANIGVNYHDKFEEYGVTHIILYSNSKLAMILEDDPNYSKLYDEGSFKIFERLDASTEE